MDQSRFLNDAILVDEPTEEELELARKLLEGRSPELIAAALVRLHRKRLPEPEEMLESRVDDRQDAGPRYEKRHSDGSGKDAAWFRIAIGRSKNADPKWLLPLICRLGHVTKKDIGSIRIFGAETRFEIFRDAEARFREAAKAAAATGEMKVEDSGPPDQEGVERRIPEKKHRPGQGFKPRVGPPPERAPERAEVPAGERPAFGRGGKADAKPYEGKPHAKPAEKPYAPDLHGKPFGKPGKPGKPAAKAFGGKPFADKAFGDKPPSKPKFGKPGGPKKFKG